MPVVATQTMLTDAREQYHKLVTGIAPRVVVDQNGERVEFTAANRQALYNYIAELERQLGTMPDTSFQAQYHPATFIF
jgi:gpW